MIRGAWPAAWSTARRGPNPVDCGTPGNKIHALADRTGLPLAALTFGANVHDAHLLLPLLDSLAPIRSRRGPRLGKPDKLHGDETYNNQYTVTSNCPETQ